MASFLLPDSKGFVCEYKKRSAWFGSFEIRYIVIEDERMKVFKNEKEYVSSKKRHNKPSITVVLRNARLKITKEQRHPHILSIQVRGTHHCLSFVNNEQLKDCQDTMLTVIQSANLIRPTLEQQHLATKSNIDENDVNTKYRAVLTNLGLPSKKIQELVKTQSFVSKMEIITQNQAALNNMNGNNNNNQSAPNENIAHWIKLLRRAQNVTVTNITDIATLLYEEPIEWMINFINEQGLTLLVSIIPHQINNTKYQIELLQCFKVICDKTYQNEKIGLKFIVNDSTAIQGIIDLFDSQDPQVSLLIIKLLSAICWHSPEGFEKVIDGLENYCENTNNQSMWIPIVTELKPMIAEISNTANHRPEMIDTYSSSLLMDNDTTGRDQFAFEYVLFSMGLINAILNSFTNLEDRVAYRKDLEQLGFDKIVAYLSDLIITMEEALINQYNDDDDEDEEDIDDPWIDKMDEHLDLYQAVKLKDMRDSSLDGIDVSNPSDLFEFLDQHCVEDGFLNEFTHILQCLTTIPRNAPYLWSTIEKVVSYSTAPIRKTQLKDIINSNDADNDNIDDEMKSKLGDELIVLEEDPEHAFPSFDQLKVMLSRYDQDLAYMVEESSHYKEQIALLQEQITNLKYQLTNHRLTYDKIAKENKKLKHRSMTSGTITVKREDLYDVLNEKGDTGKANKSNKRQKHKRKSSLLDRIGLTTMFTSKTNLNLNGLNDENEDDDDGDDHLIDVSDAFQQMIGSRSPHSLLTSTTEHTPPPISTHSHTKSSSFQYKPRGYTARNDTTSPITPNTQSIITQGVPSPLSPMDDIKNAESVEPGVAVIGGGIGGLPPPPMSPSVSKSNGGEQPTDNKQVVNNAEPVHIEPVEPSGPPPELIKYLKMLKMGLPQVAVEHKMRKDHVDTEILIDYLEDGGSIDPPTAKPKTPVISNTSKKPAALSIFDQIKAKNASKSTSNKPVSNGEAAKKQNDNEAPEKLKKYLKMMKLKIPLAVIQNKMKQNGDNPQDLENWLNPPAPTSNKAPKEAPEKLKRYLKMKKMNIPLMVIKNKMKQNGDNPQDLEDWLNPPAASKTPPPELEKYLKMMKMKIPINVIKNKMKQNGANPQILEDWINGGSSESARNTKKKKKKKEDPNALPKGMKPKTKIKPNKKMRALHWNPVRPKEIKHTIWDGLDESKINIDVGGFEGMFQQKMIAQKTKGGGKDNKNSSKQKDDKKNEEIHLIDGKRSYNVDIGLSRFKLTHQQIKDAILLLDEEVLNMDKVIKLRNYVPDTNEQEQLRNFDGDVTLLAHTERFYLALCNIPDLCGRMDLWQFKLQFNELLITQKERINILRESHDNVKNSKAFKIILQYILAFGNYMNGGTRKGGVFGFKLNSLRQVCSAKSVDNKTTLLQYLYIQIEKNQPSALEFINHFEILSEGSRLDTSQLTAEVNKIGGTLNRIKKKLKDDKKAKTPRNQHDLFQKKMTSFLDDAQPHFNELKLKHDKAKDDCTKLAEYFNCKNDIKFEFFKDLYQFSLSFKQIGIKIHKQREKEAKDLKNAQIKAQRQERLKRKKGGNISSNISSNKSTKTKTKNGVNGGHRRTSSNRANQLYSKNGLNKKGGKRTSIKKGGMGATTVPNEVGMDPQLIKMLQRQEQKTNNISSTNGTNSNRNSFDRQKSNGVQSYAQRRQSRNSRRGGTIPSSPVTPPHNKRDSGLNGVIQRSTTTPIMNGNKNEITKSNDYDGPPSPIKPLSPFAMNGTNGGLYGGLSGLPPPPENDENVYLDSPITENVVNDIKLSEIQNRRKASSQISRSKSRTPRTYSKEQNRQKISYVTSPKNKKIKKKKKWFGF